MVCGGLLRDGRSKGEKLMECGDWSNVSRVFGMLEEEGEFKK